LLAITSQYILEKRNPFYFFHSNQRKRGLVVDAPKSSKFKYRKEEPPLIDIPNLKRITGGVIIQGFMPAKDIGQKSP
jgi:hypothetical protein